MHKWRRWDRKRAKLSYLRWSRRRLPLFWMAKQTKKQLFCSKAREGWSKEAITQDKYERVSSLDQHLPMPPRSHPRIFLGKGKRHRWKSQTLGVGGPSEGESDGITRCIHRRLSHPPLLPLPLPPLQCPLPPSPLHPPNPRRSQNPQNTRQPHLHMEINMEIQAFCFNPWSGWITSVFIWSNVNFCVNLILATLLLLKDGVSYIWCCG